MKKTVFVLIAALAMFSSLVYAGDLKLEGINYDPQNPAESLALINGELLKAGQTVGNYEIVSVGRLEIQIKDSKSGEIKTINMNEEFAKAPPKTKAASEKSAKADGPAAVFNLFQKKAMEGGGSSGAEAVKKANFMDSFGTALQGMMPAGGAAGDYQKFTNALFRGQFDEAKKLVQGGSAAASSLQKKSTDYSSCVAEFGRRFSAAAYKVESQNKKSDTELELVVMQTVRGDPPGVTSAMGATAVLYKHQATMIKTDQGWKVKSFSFKPEGTPPAGTFWLCVD